MLKSTFYINLDNLKIHFITLLLKPNLFIHYILGEVVTSSIQISPPREQDTRDIINLLL